MVYHQLVQVAAQSEQRKLPVDLQHCAHPGCYSSGEVTLRFWAVRLTDCTLHKE